MAAKKKTKKKTGPKVTRQSESTAGARSRKKRATFQKVGGTPGVKTSVLRFLGFWVLRLGIAAFVFLLGYTLYLDISIRKQFEGKKWALPAHVYTRPMELYIGQRFDPMLVQQELDELGYVDRQDLTRVGSYRFDEAGLSIHQRQFRFWDTLQPAQLTRLEIANGRINSIRVKASDQSEVDTEIVRLEPRLFGSVSPMSHEDRTLVKLDEVPQALIDALIVNEDRQFYSHFGINPVGIMRAMVKNVRAGRVVQGGSTLTQQLVKNYYLYKDQTFKRKFIEMIMAVLLEIHYTKDEILQAYINEVYMSQAGNRAIHGFGLASRYFYGRPLQELELHQIATLVAVNNGPSRYNPIRNPQRALKRRDLVLKTMLEQNVISEQDYQAARSNKLALSVNARRAATLSYPGFLGLVRNNLQSDYLQEDLLSEGLQIYTTLNPRIQADLERTVANELSNIERTKRLEEGSLQVAAVVIRTDNGEVAAVVGDRKAGFSGYNRAVKAQRPVGSLLKPFVFLTALEQPEKYSLATKLMDEPIVVSQKGSPDWLPQNYDGEVHGEVMLIDALARSYNLATVQLGMEIGVEEVAKTIRRLGYRDDFSTYPSMLLGAVPMSVMDVGQLYLSLASGGFKTPIKSVRAVLSNEYDPLVRYSLDIEQVIEPQYSALINYALQDVVRNGTARSSIRGFRYDYGLAGKTGTTNDYRDSWFAGFSENYLTVVWVGRDDNKPTGLTGASGAAKVWSKSMQSFPLTRLDLPYHDELVRERVYYTGRDDLEPCLQNRSLPFVTASLPIHNVPCEDRIQYDEIPNDEADHFEVDGNEPNRPKKKSWWQRLFG